MAIHTCLMAIFVGAAIGGVTTPTPPDPGMLIATHEVLMDVELLCVVPAMEQMSQAEQVIDANSLKSRIEARLDEADIKHVEFAAGPGPKLVVHIDGVAVPGSDQYAYRVQTSLERMVLLTGRPNPQIQAEVWQSRPIMEVVDKIKAAEAMTTAALAQAEAFITARKIARASPASAGATAQKSSGLVPAGSQNPPAGSKYPFVASKGSSIFHRPNCRWAQNISDNNLVGYQSQAEAVQAGKRPCKTCKP